MTVAYSADGSDRHGVVHRESDVSGGPVHEPETAPVSELYGTDIGNPEQVGEAGILTFRHTPLQDEGRHMVAASGEIDLATAPALRTELLAALVRHSPRLVLDLSGVTFLDSTGLAVLVAVHRRARAAGGELSLFGPQPVVRKLLGITYLDRVFPFYEGPGR